MACKLRCELLTKTAQNEVAQILRWRATGPTSRSGFPDVSDTALVLFDNLTECWEDRGPLYLSAQTVQFDLCGKGSLLHRWIIIDAVRSALTVSIAEMQEVNSDGRPNIDVTKEATDAVITWILRPSVANAERCYHLHHILNADNSIGVIAAGWAAEGAGWQLYYPPGGEPSVEAAAAASFWPRHSAKSHLLEEADAWERLRFLSAVRDLLPEPTESCIRILE